jgi:DNA-binding transcriptional MerR regulator
VIEPGALRTRRGVRHDLRTIRFYEDRGCCLRATRAPPESFHDRDRVRCTDLAGKRLGFTLDEIAHVINIVRRTPGERGSACLPAPTSASVVTLCWPSVGTDEALTELDDLEALPSRSRAAQRTG